MRPIATNPEGRALQPTQPDEVLIALYPREITMLVTGLTTALHCSLIDKAPLVTNRKFHDTQEVTTSDLGKLLNQFVCSDLPIA